MKKIFLLLTVSVLALSSCNGLYEDFTDLKPKGKNLLSSADELELLLNLEMMYMGYTDFKTVASDIITGNDPYMTVLSQPKPTRTSIMWTYDDSKMNDLADLTNTDATYTDMFSLIGTVCNPILGNVEFATGDKAKKDQVAAEAHALRAWALYVLVNKFAKAYNPATAANDPAIPVYLEDDDISINARQWTVQEVYDQILADAQAAIDMDAIPTVAENRMRVCKAFPYAIKCFALLAMQNYTEAEKAGKESIAITSDICDYYSEAFTRMQVPVAAPYMPASPILVRGRQGTAEDLLFTFDNAMGDWYTPECMAFFEPGHAMIDRISDQDKFMGPIFGPGGYSSVTVLLPGLIGTFDTQSMFNPFGVKTTQVYLAVAEAEIQQDNISSAIEYIDKVREKRIDPSIYAPLKGTISAKADAILALKKTAHGEGILTIWNFVDRKRWNQLDDFKQSWTRTLGESYTITPESPMWVFPLPKNALTLNSNISQNYDKK